MLVLLQYDCFWSFSGGRIRCVLSADVVSGFWDDDPCERKRAKIAFRRDEMHIYRVGGSGFI